MLQSSRRLGSIEYEGMGWIKVRQESSGRSVVLEQERRCCRCRRVWSGKGMEGRLGTWAEGRLFKDVDDERLSGQDSGRSHANSLEQFTWTEDVVLHLVRERLHSWLRAAHTAPAPEDIVTSPDGENPRDIHSVSRSLSIVTVQNDFAHIHLQARQPAHIQTHLPSE